MKSFFDLTRTGPCSVIACALIVITSASATADGSRSEARVTQLIGEVSLLDAAVPARRAIMNQKVREGTSVRTGGDSRAELTFIDLTITRLGANTLYSFKKAGRHAELKNGSSLLRVPKDSGGATIFSGAITAGITGTTLIFETTRAMSRLTVLEGSARLSLVRHPEQARSLLAGQSLQVPEGATRISEPTEIDLDRLMKTSPLIIGFRPLPSQGLIGAAIKQQQERGQQNQNGPGGRAGSQNQNMPAPPPPAPPPGPGPR